MAILTHGHPDLGALSETVHHFCDMETETKNVPNNNRKQIER